MSSSINPVNFGFTFQNTWIFKYKWLPSFSQNAMILTLMPYDQRQAFNLSG